MATDPRRYTVEFSRAALQQLRELDRKAQERVAPRITALGADPRPRGAEMLKGADGLYRIRIGDYRVVDAIQDDRLVVLVVKVGHRRDVYRKR